MKLIYIVLLLCFSLRYGSGFSQRPEKIIGEYGTIWANTSRSLQITLSPSPIMTASCAPNNTFLMNDSCVSMCPSTGYIADVNSYVCSPYSSSNYTVPLYYFLRATKDPATIQIVFNIRDQYLINLFLQFLTLTVNNGAYSTFSYVIFDHNTTTFDLMLSFFDYLPGGSTIQTQILLPAFVDNNIIYTINPTLQTVQSLEYYPYSSSFFSGLSSISEALDVLTFVTQMFAVILQVLRPRRSQLFQVYFWLQQVWLLRFIPIYFPVNVLKLWASLDGSTFGYSDTLNSAVSGMFNSLKPGYMNPTIRSPGRFDTYDVSPYYVNNFGSRIVIFFLIIIIAVIWWVIAKLTKKLEPRLRRIIEEIDGLLMWNFLLGGMMAFFLPNLFYIAIGFQTSDATAPKFVTASNALAAIFTTFIVLPLVCGLLAWKQRSIVGGIKRVFKRKGKLRGVYELDRCSVFFRDYKTEKGVQFQFNTLYLAKALLLFILVCFGSSFPVLQMTLIFVMNTVFLILLACFRPYQESWIVVESIACESLILVINFISWVFCLMDATGSTDVLSKGNLGWIIYFVYVVLVLWILGWILYELFHAIKDILNALQGRDSEPVAPQEYVKSQPRRQPPPQQQQPQLQQYIVAAQDSPIKREMTPDTRSRLNRNLKKVKQPYDELNSSQDVMLPAYSLSASKDDPNLFNLEEPEQVEFTDIAKQQPPTYYYDRPSLESPSHNLISNPARNPMRREPQQIVNTTGEDLLKTQADQDFNKRNFY